MGTYSQATEQFRRTLETLDLLKKRKKEEFSFAKLLPSRRREAKNGKKKLLPLRIREALAEAKR